MNANPDLKMKIIAAFKGFITTQRLEPVKGRSKQDSAYYRSLRFFQSDESSYELQYQRWKRQIILELVDRLFPGQVDRQFVHKVLMRAATAWIEHGYDKNDQVQLELAAEKFISDVERGIESRIVFIPVTGLEVNVHQPLQLGRCHLYSNSPDSELMQLVKQHRERLRARPDELFPVFEQAPAYFRIKLSGHSQKTIERGKEEVELALNILRLYMASYYLDIYQSPQVQRRMGVSGTLFDGSHSNVMFIKDGIPIDEQYPGSNDQFRHNRSFQIRTVDLKAMKLHGIDKINQYIGSSESSLHNEVSPRMLRAISWFGKAAASSNAVDSYIMCAISIECLISEGNTPKETYAKYIASLLARKLDTELFGGDFSQEFGKKINALDRIGCFEIIRDRVIELFSHRNDIVHGRVLDAELDINKLLDFESLARNFIIAFAISGWNNLEEFKTWVDSLS